MADPVQVLDGALFDSLVDRARIAPRLRTNHNFHASLEENPHRFLNVMARGTYITPHRHLDPPKTESFIILEGRIAFFTFADNGSVERIHILERAQTRSATVGVDIQPGIWHSLAVLSDSAVCFEVKPGPYSAANDKDFAPWAPREGDAACADYLRRLEALATQPAS